jgi:hypothetical protein
MHTFLLVALTALASSACTLAAAFLFYRVYLSHRLENRLAELADTLEERVRRGVKEAGIELLPAFQERVEDGFKNAMVSLPEQGASTIAKAGANLLGEGLTSLFGGRRGPGK